MDKAMIEGQQQVVSRSPGVHVMPTPADRAVIAFQRIVNRLTRSERVEGADALSLPDADPEKNQQEDACAS